MDEEIASRVEELRADFARITGRPFTHFFCPVLWRDDDVALCRGHVVNKAFIGASRAWTVQRQDVDNFFGAHFESDFVLLQERERHTIGDLLSNPALAQKFRPAITLDGRPVPYYRPNSTIPDAHTEVHLEEKTGATVRLAIKMAPSATLEAESRDWSVGFEKDLRLPALVSLLKAAHLSLFQLLGYDWGASAGGRFVGYDALGAFYLRNAGAARAVVTERASEHFREYRNLIRPFAIPPGELQGTVSDRRLFLCGAGSVPWGFLVIVRAGASYHGVILPTLADADVAGYFMAFLHEPSPRIYARLATFQGEHWDVSTREQALHWPEPNWV